MIAVADAIYKISNTKQLSFEYQAADCYINQGGKDHFPAGLVSDLEKIYKERLEKSPPKATVSPIM